jgi:hypothetical protein
LSRPYLFAQASTGSAGTSGTAASPSTGTTQPDDRATAFKPVEGGNQMQSGEKLMVEAYAAFWLIAFVFILFSYRRQRGIDQRVADLEAAVAKARKDGAGES